MHVREAPLAELRHFRRALAVARLPWPLRRLLWWLALNIGRQRANQFGTFGMSAIPEAGVEVFVRNESKVPIHDALVFDVLAALKSLLADVQTPLGDIGGDEPSTDLL